MKKIYTLISIMLLGVGAFAQCTVAITNSTNVSCFGSCDGSATATAAGIPPYSYSWSPSGDTIQDPINLCPGTHTVTMTTSTGCVASTSVVITEPTMLQDSTTQTNVFACDSCNGTATAYPYGGTPILVTGYNHKWSTTPPQTTATATGLCPGTYTDTITDDNNCQIVATVTITQAAPFSITTMAVDASSPTACDGSASVNPSGGNAPYTYEWTPSGDTTSSITAQCPGTYTVCVTDADGCMECDSTVVIGPTTGIYETVLADKVSIFPNPSVDGQFSILADRLILNSTFTVMNVLGKQVFNSTIKTQKTKIDMTNQPKGIYFIQINTGNTSVLKKVIIH
ncbi:MAG: T9SS type A sorting domain-containing protein [Flavobacteriales bacterium]